MGFFDFLTDAIGNNQNNDPKDIRTAKRNLARAKTFDENNDSTENTIITRELDNGIRRFQNNNNLFEDGIMKPGGETERTLLETLTGKPADTVFTTAENDTLGHIGFGGNISGRIEETPKNKPKTPKPIPLPPQNNTTQNENDTNNTLITTPSGLRINPTRIAEKLNEITQNEETPPTPPTPKRKPQTPNTNETPPPVPERKPEIIAPTTKGNELLDFIGKLESSDNYNVIVGGDKASLTKMTIKEIRALQKKRRNKNLGTPVGKYQIKDTTMDYLIKKMGLRDNEIFDEKLQDQMGRQLLEHRGFEKFKAGKISTEDFIRELAKEWAALPQDASNKSRYGNVGNNRALTDFKTVKELLEK